MSMSVLPARIYMHHVCASCSQRAEQGVRFLKLELWMVVSHHVGAGNQARSSAREASALSF